MKPEAGTAASGVKARLGWAQGDCPNSETEPESPQNPLVGAGWWEWGTLPRDRGRRLPNLKAADEVVPSQQLKNDGPQGMVVCCPVQGKDIKAPKVHVLWRNKELGRETPKRDIPAAARAAVRPQGGLSNDYRRMGCRKIRKW